MHIVQHCPSLVPPVGYGGIERVVFWLTRELVRKGHQITVLAREGSTVAQEIPGVACVPLPPDDPFDRSLYPSDADLVHFHAPPPDNRLPELPFVVTEHGNRRRSRGQAPNRVFLGRRHAKNHRGELFIPLGVPKEEFPLCAEKEDYLLFMALVASRKKNVATLVHLALDTGMPARIAGGDLWHTPRIRGWWKWRARRHRDLIENVGVVGGDEKLRLLQRARALFYIVHLHEPFGLAPHEALACGTPVLASPNGALPEYIEDGQNGFVVSSYREALAAVRRLRALGADQTAAWAHRCRKSAYSIATTADRYLELYDRVIRERWLFPPAHAKRLHFRRSRRTVVRRPLWAAFSRGP